MCVAVSRCVPPPEHQQQQQQPTEASVLLSSQTPFVSTATGTARFFPRQNYHNNKILSYPPPQHNSVYIGGFSGP